MCRKLASRNSLGVKIYIKMKTLTGAAAVAAGRRNRAKGQLNEMDITVLALNYSRREITHQKEESFRKSLLVSLSAQS